MPRGGVLPEERAEGKGVGEAGGETASEISGLGRLTRLQARGGKGSKPEGGRQAAASDGDNRATGAFPGQTAGITRFQIGVDIRSSENLGDIGMAFIRGETADSTVEGFTLDKISVVFQGSSSPRLTNCTIKGSFGVLCEGDSAPVFTNCVLTENWGNCGGGVYCTNSSCPEFTDCVITGNVTDDQMIGGRGGGLCCDENSCPVLTNCTITGNSACWGGGVYCRSRGRPVLANCTITGNVVGSGLLCDASSPEIVNCIIWDNPGGSITRVDGASDPNVSFSCIEGDEVWPGEGNINEDPLFCGWDGAEIRVTNQGEFEDALTGFSLSLSIESPCLGTGRDGADMGADTGTCDEVGDISRRIQLSRGVYSIVGFSLFHNVSIAGSGEDATVIEGTVSGLRTGARLSQLRVTKGGGVHVGSGEAPEISDCMITGNGGGGISCAFRSSPIITNCTISENSACLSGAGVSCVSASPKFTNCKIIRNSTICDDGYGAGIDCTGVSSPVFTNCTITGNLATFGGGIYCDSDSLPVFTNCTISGNLAEAGGGVYCRLDSSLILTNCIFWANSGGSICDVEPSDAQISYSCIEGEEIWPGEGNISTDPLFIQPGHWDDNDTPDDTSDDIWIEGDYHLQPGSPCIDTGTSEGAPTTDIEGNGRPCGAGVDMGAYEMGSCPEPPERFVRGDSNSDGKLDIADPIYTLL
ncbi:right-handed parallel beta-helix repeat-containing protein, partial [Candidatus Fermentibacteria bacterium]|nr:right-handed parallel beta-helix repeat-containing protein [Candidatus Fermentibacteria bacterium]